MPIYEYRCTDCDRAFEAFVRPGRDEAECPSCHGAKLVRELSVFAAASSAPRNAGNGSAAAPEAPLRGNVCCGGGCGCR
jgi:putative FmdB family regulatory protein